MKIFYYGLVMLACLSAAVSGAADEAKPVLRVLHSAQTSYQGAAVDTIVDTFSALTGVDIDVAHIAYAEQHEHLLEAIGDYDVVAIDQAWLKELTTKELLSPLTHYQSHSIRNDIMPEVLSAFRIRKELMAFPALLNFQLFFYNRAMIKEAGFSKAPRTLEELLEQMMALKNQGIVQYPWTDSWRKGESLLCDYIWLTAAFGGELFDDNGQPSFDSTEGVSALEFMRLLIDKQLAHPDILQNDELAVTDQFLARKAAFTSNWVFMQGFIRQADPPIRSEGAIALLPIADGKSMETVSVSAFQGLAIPADAADKALAWQWIAFFTSPLVQRAYLYEMPIWTSLQQSDDAKLFFPGHDIRHTQLKNARQRPMLDNYSQVSSILQEHLYAALKGRVLPDEALRQAKTEIQSLHKNNGREAQK
ncbi:hypothetical protein CSB45_11350 [candidate division KSB3 bacterium]|uniref:ABC transporter substrate-binding protein n=1 Tax=candidate division KSB3 bacterium TaxID=2044937 RepID=A0A2G6E3W2_9BACT|nr:MAG: hypothetical protein CSB45_11350 [candidate division KSB3 bacterium]PIE28908.1 MAG: hypothetical protein CSA57_11400 [candidate division KSB3 bacterium]